MVRIDESKKEQTNDYEALKNDYINCCEQLKARDGDLTKLKLEYDELSKLYTENVQQLDQESDSNAKLEDQLKEVSEAEEGGNVHTQKLIEEIKLLQEKLALCDSYYKAKTEQLERIKNICSEEPKSG